MNIFITKNITKHKNNSQLNKSSVSIQPIKKSKVKNGLLALMHFNNIVTLPIGVLIFWATKGKTNNVYKIWICISSAMIITGLFLRFIKQTKKHIFNFLILNLKKQKNN